LRRASGGFALPSYTITGDTTAKAAAAPVSVATEKRGDPMDAQARMLDDDSFESRWRARVSSQ
jgi:hypothetical protein